MSATSTAPMDSAARGFELVVPVTLPPEMTAEEFLSQTYVEWARGGHADTRNPAAFAVGVDLDKMPRFTGPKELRRPRPLPPPTTPKVTKR